MIYAVSFIIFGLLLIISIFVDIILLLAIKFSKDEKRKEKLKAMEKRASKTVSFSMFMTLASITLAAIFKDPPEMLIPSSIWNFIQQNQSIGVLLFVFYIWIVLDRRLTKVETKLEHIDKDVESLRDDFKKEIYNVREDFRQFLNLFRKS